MDKINIDIQEEFPLFPRAPIVESVIDIRSMPSVSLDEATIREAVSQQLPDYNYLDTQHETVHEVKFSPEGGIEPRVLDPVLMGFRFQHKDQPQIVKFNKDGFVFSRLEPYVSWEDFVQESLGLWALYIELTKPEEVNRIGLRFINRILMPTGESLFEEYLQPAPSAPNGFDVPFYNYMHKDTLSVPGHQYSINLIKAIEPPRPDEGVGVGLILDIDVFTLQGVRLHRESVVQCLHEMRWLKNKVFFGSITKKAQESFQ